MTEQEIQAAICEEIAMVAASFQRGDLSYQLFKDHVEFMLSGEHFNA